MAKNKTTGTGDKSKPTAPSTAIPTVAAPPAVTPPSVAPAVTPPAVTPPAGKKPRKTPVPFDAAAAYAGKLFHVDLLRKGLGIVETDLAGLTDLRGKYGEFIPARLSDDARGDDAYIPVCEVFKPSKLTRKAMSRGSAGKRGNREFASTGRNGAAATLLDLLRVCKPQDKHFVYRVKGLTADGSETFAFARGTWNGIANAARFRGVTTTLVDDADVASAMAVLAAEPATVAK